MPRPHRLLARRPLPPVTGGGRPTPASRARSTAAALLASALLAACSGQGSPGPDAAPDSVRGSGGTNAERHRAAPHMVMVSFDGFRPDYVDRYDAPNFRRVAAAGARAERMIPVFPSKTFPAHYTMVTGMYAENHGLVGNTFWDPEKEATYSIGNRAVVEDGSWYGGEPIWVTAETQGMVAASYFWVGSEADVMGVRPTHWRRYDGRVPNEARVDQVLAWLDEDPATRPHMVTLYFSDADDAGHRYGPDSPQVAEAVAELDGVLGRLLDGVAALPHGDQVYLVLVSDHGMLPQRAAMTQPLDMDLFPGVRLVEDGPYASLFVDEGGAARAAHVRDSIDALLDHAGVYLREDVPERLHYRADPAIGDIVVVMEPEWTVLEARRAPFRDTFNHGWDNQAEGMGALFLAMGPGIAPGQRIAPFESVHLYPLVAHLLGLTPNPEADGRLEVLRGILGPG